MLAVWPETGIGQDRGRSASPEELWQDYPLKPADEADADGAPRESQAAGSRPETSSQRPEAVADDEGGRGRMALVVGLLAVPLVVLIALQVLPDARRRSRRPRGEATAPAAPTWDARRGSAWTAEIRWGGDASRFRVLASPPAGQEELRMLESRRLDWPPRSDAAVESLVDAVADLERSVVAAGWQAVEPGSSWFARRFVWPRTDRAPDLRLERRDAAEEVRQWANRGAG